MSYRVTVDVDVFADNPVDAVNALDLVLHGRERNFHQKVVNVETGEVARVYIGEGGAYVLSDVDIDMDSLHLFVADNASVRVLTVGEVAQHFGAPVSQILDMIDESNGVIYLVRTKDWIEDAPETWSVNCEDY